MKTIQLTQGKVAFVDDADFVRVSQFKWHAFKNQGGKWYARSTSLARQIGKSIWMHRLIVRAKDEQQVDHRDGNGLNNRRKNLRCASNAQNAYNMALRPNSLSGYKGVSRYSSHNRYTGEWVASIKHNGKKLYLGKFIDPKDAALAYDAKAKELFGEFAWLNFPSEARI